MKQIILSPMFYEYANIYSNTFPDSNYEIARVFKEELAEYVNSIRCVSKRDRKKLIKFISQTSAIAAAILMYIIFAIYDIASPEFLEAFLSDNLSDDVYKAFVVIKIKI